MYLRRLERLEHACPPVVQWDAGGRRQDSDVDAGSGLGSGGQSGTKY